nr:MAG TPA: hypothetical protein [Bacteriophage sp.]
MACIKKIGKNYIWSCEESSDTIGGISEAVIINAADIRAVSLDGGVASISRVAGSKGYVVENANGSINVSFALKANAVTTSGLDAVVTMTLPNETLNSSDDLSANPILSAEVAIAFRAAGGYYVVGLGEPLSATEIVADTASMGTVVVTWGLQEYQLGTVKASITSAIYESLKTTA